MNEAAESRSSQQHPEHVSTTAPLARAAHAASCLVGHQGGSQLARDMVARASPGEGARGFVWQRAEQAREAGKDPAAGAFEAWLELFMETAAHQLSTQQAGSALRNPTGLWRNRNGEVHPTSTLAGHARAVVEQLARMKGEQEKSLRYAAELTLLLSPEALLAALEHRGGWGQVVSRMSVHSLEHHEPPAWLGEALRGLSGEARASLMQVAAHHATPGIPRAPESWKEQGMEVAFHGERAIVVTAGAASGRQACWLRRDQVAGLLLAIDPGLLQGIRLARAHIKVQALGGHLSISSPDGKVGSTRLADLTPGPDGQARAIIGGGMLQVPGELLEQLREHERSFAERDGQLEQRVLQARTAYEEARRKLQQADFALANWRRETEREVKKALETR